MKASKDFKESATAVAKAIDVLSEYYGSSFVQVSAKQPEFGGAKGDVGSTIVSVLEVAESDFTSLLAESEADESSAQEAYDKLTQENAVRQKRPSQSHHFFSNLPFLPTDSKTPAEILQQGSNLL